MPTVRERTGRRRQNGNERKRSYRLTGLQPGDQIVKVILSCYPNPSEKATVVEAGTTVNFTC